MTITGPINSGASMPDLSGLWNSGPLRPFRQLYENDKAAHDIAYGFIDRFGVARSLDDSGTVLHWGANLTSQLGGDNNAIQNLLRNTGNALKAAASPEHHEIRKGLIGLPVGIAETILTSPFHPFFGLFSHMVSAPGLLQSTMFTTRFGGCLMDFGGQISQWLKLGKEHSAVETALSLLQQHHPEILKKLIMDTSAIPLTEANFATEALTQKTVQDYLKRVHKLPKNQLFTLMEQPVYKALHMDRLLAKDPAGFMGLLQKPASMLKAHVNGESVAMGFFEHLWSLLKGVIAPLTKLVAKAA